MWVGLNRTHGTAVLVALLLVACLAASRFRVPDRELAQVRAGIEALLRTDRYFGPRLSAGGDYLSCSDAKEAIGLACRPAPSPGSPHFATAVRLVQKLSAETPRRAAEAHHLTGLALLLAGDAEAASEELLVALGIEPTNEEIASDLVAAHLIRFESTEDPRALLDAFRSAGDFHPGETSYAPLLFNWALMLERTGLLAEAEATWNRYLSTETDSGWREEASARLTQLRELPKRDDWEVTRVAMTKGRLTDELPPDLLQHARLLVEDELLGQWADLELQGDRRANHRLNSLSRVVQELALAQRDRLLLDAMEELSKPASRKALAEAHRSYSLGRKAHEAQDYDVAGAHFHQAADRFRAAGSPFEIWPRFYLAVILHHRPAFKAAHHELLEIQRDSRLLEYPLAAAYVDWMLGLGSSRMADYHRAVHHFTSARNAFMAAGEAENAGAMESELAGLAEKIASPAEAWRHHHAALARIPQVLKSRRKQNILIAAGEFLHGQGVDEAAKLYLGSAVGEAEQSGSALSVALTLQQQARFRTAIGWFEPAQHDLQRALTAARAIPDPGLRADTQLFLELALADQLQRSDPAATVAILDQVLVVARERDAERSLITALAARARAHLQLDEHEAAIEDLKAALSEVERQRWRLEDPGERRAFLSAARDVLEELVRLKWQSGRFASALQWVERFRGRVLGESMGVPIEGSYGETPALRPEDLPPRTVVLAFLVADDELFTWRLSREGMQVDRRPVAGNKSLDSLVTSFRASLQTRGDQHGSGKRLADIVLPRELGVEGVMRWVFVPDAALHKLPFAALPLSDGSRLIEHGSVVVAPSIAGFLQLDANSGRAPSWRSNLLVVSDVEHDSVSFPELIPLTFRKALRSRKEMAGARLLTGAAATPAAFLDQARSATVLYFAGHAVAETPYRPGGIVLARGAEGDGLLSIEELRSLAPTRLRLAILAACGTGTGRLTALDGPDSIVQPFLAAGVSSVVGTLWEVEDLAADRFFLAYMSKENHLDRVRAAQLELLRSDPEDWSWAAFQHFGSGWALTSEELASREPFRMRELN